MPDEDVRGVMQRFPDYRLAQRPTPESLEDVEWWRRVDGDFFTEPDGHPGVPRTTDLALRFHHFAEQTQAWSDAIDEMKCTLMELLPRDAGEVALAAVARKADPATALIYALGAEAAMKLPGWFGNMLLTSTQARRALPGAEAALTMSDERRDVVRSRVSDWLEGFGDDPHHDIDELIDGPLRVLRHAAENNLGVVGFTEWY
jgi:hypothetical protein